jgi:hypothetical protein
MGMPATDAKHVFIIREALDVGRFQAGAGQQEFRLAMKDRDGDEIFLHLNSLAELRSAGQPGAAVPTWFSMLSTAGLPAAHR